MEHINPFKNFPYTQIGLKEIDISEIKNEPSFRIGYLEGDKISYNYLLKRFNLIQKNKIYQIKGHVILKLKALQRKHKEEQFFVYGLLQACEDNYETLQSIYDKVSLNTAEQD